MREEEKSEVGVSIPSAGEARGYYDLFLRVYQDLRGVAFKKKAVRHENLQTLFSTLRAIHVDYVRMYSRLLNNLEYADTVREVESAKGQFLEDRQRRTEARALAVFDAKALKDSSDSEPEREFLEAVAHYVNGRTITDDGITYNSRSRHFWSEIIELSEKDELISLVNNSLASISNDYARLFRAFSAIGPARLLGNEKSGK